MSEDEILKEIIGRWLVGKRLVTGETQALKILEIACKFAAMQEHKRSCMYLDGLHELGVPGFSEPYDFGDEQMRRSYFTWVDEMLNACRKEWSRKKFDEIIIPILKRAGYTWRRGVDDFDRIDFKPIGRK